MFFLAAVSAVELAGVSPPRFENLPMLSY